MTVERDKDGTLAFCCDGCDETAEVEPGESFQEAWTLLKEAGWRAYKEDDEWQHKCPDCMSGGGTYKRPPLMRE